MDKNEKELTNVQDIIHEQENFYKDLYSSKLDKDIPRMQNPL